MNKEVRLSAYYRAHIPQEKVWFFVATIRSYDHLVFDRTVDIEHSIFELFVAPESVAEFERLMVWYTTHEVVYQLQRLDPMLASCFAKT